MRIAHGTRDAEGVWHPDDPGVYQPLDVHGVFPWSVLRQDLPAWQGRKKHWKNIGVDTPEPRAEAQSMMSTGRHGALSGGVSIFDPVLAEILIEWHTRIGDHVIDPYAGGAVRGIVTTTLDRTYHGVDVNPIQVTANRALSPIPQWEVAAAQATTWEAADYILTCPPYHRLERYTDNPSDLSTMRWDEFLTALGDGLRNAATALRDNRFATIIISDVRDSKGHYRRLPHHAADIADAAGLNLINDQILVAPTGTAHKRMRVPWEAARTTTRIHQHVLTFVKGDRRAATRRLTC